MKRISLFLLALIALISLPAQAKLKWGVKGGANISNVHLKELPEAVKTKNFTGFHLGPMIEATVPLVGIGFDFSLLYSQMGTEIGTTKIKTNYLDVPLNLKWKFGTPMAKVYAAAGPFVGFRLGDGKVWDIVATQIEEKSFSAGLNIGAGVELAQHLQIGATYHWGMTDNYSIAKVGSDGKNRCWQISAAILF